MDVKCNNKRQTKDGAMHADVARKWMLNAITSETKDGAMHADVARKWMLNAITSDSLARRTVCDMSSRLRSLGLTIIPLTDDVCISVYLTTFGNTNLYPS